MTTIKDRADQTDRPTDDLESRAEQIRQAEDFETMRGLLGELPPGIFPPKSEFGFRFRRRNS